MSISALTNEDIKEFCGIDEDFGLLEVYKKAAKNFILGYTGLTAEELDNNEDLAFAYLVIINDMSINRDYTISKDTINPTVSAILNLHCKNHITG